MSLVLGSGGVSALAGDRARLAALRRRGLWPPQVPAVVLVESLTGDARRDFSADRLLRSCQVREVDEAQARVAARLRTLTRRAGSTSAADALVAALASSGPGSVVVTSDPGDIGALAEHATVPFGVVAV